MKIERYKDKKSKRWCWRVDFTLKGQRIRESNFESRDQADAFIAEMKQRERDRRYGIKPAQRPITLQQLRNKRAADANSFKPKLTTQMLDLLLSVCPEGMLLSELKRHHVRSLTDKLRARNLKPNTINLYLACVSGALHDACEYFPSLDDWQPPPISRVKGAEHRERTLSREELGKLFSVLNSNPDLTEIGDTLRLMLLTGCRRIEIRQLNAGLINRDWHFVQLQKTKNTRKRLVALSKTAETILGKYSNSMMADCSESQFYDLMAEVSAAAAIPYGNATKEGWVPHDLRHTVATTVESSGVRYSVVSALLGHKRKDETATYTHASLADLHEAVKVMETWCQEIDGFTSDHLKLDRLKPIITLVSSEK